MAIDRFDGIVIAGLALLIASAFVLDVVVVAAMTGGFLLSVALWRLYDGRPWEALGWLAWVGAAVSLVLDLGSAAVLTAFLGFVLVGLVLLLGSRFDVFVDVWTVESES